VLKKHNVEEQLHSNNEHQQFQNGRAEKLVDSIGRKIRGMLLQSQMPPEFWGAAVLLATDIYNCTPHHRLGIESPHYHRYHKQPDFSFFCAFGLLLLCIEAGTSSSTPSLHHGESWACIWVSAPVTVVMLLYSTVPRLLGYMPLLTPDEMILSFLHDQLESVWSGLLPLYSTRTAVSLPRHAESDSSQHCRTTSKHCRPL